MTNIKKMIYKQWIYKVYYQLFHYSIGNQYVDREMIFMPTCTDKHFKWFNATLREEKINK